MKAPYHLPQQPHEVAHWESLKNYTLKMKHDPNLRKKKVKSTKYAGNLKPKIHLNVVLFTPQGSFV